MKIDIIGAFFICFGMFIGAFLICFGMFMAGFAVSNTFNPVKAIETELAGDQHCVITAEVAND